MTARLGPQIALLNLLEGALRMQGASVQSRVSAALGYAEQLSRVLHAQDVAAGELISLAGDADLSGVAASGQLEQICNAIEKLRQTMVPVEPLALVAARRGEEQAGAVAASSQATLRGATPADSSSTMPHRAGLVISIGARAIIRGEACGCWRSEDGSLFASCEAHT